MSRIRKVHVLLAAVTAALCVPASGVSSNTGGPSTITKIGKGEGSLNLIAWEGYTQPQWVKPFTKTTGCKVRAKYGGSSDETVSVLRRFEPLLRSWRSEPDDGQADAINRGFAETTGEIMAWLNSDDLLLPGTLAYVAQYFAKHPEVDVVYGNRIMIDDDDGQIGSWILPAHDDHALTLADYVPQETLFWRRRIWDAAGGSVDTSFAFAIDWDLLLRFRAAGRCAG